MARAPHPTRRAPLLQVLPPAALAAIEGVAVRRRYRAGDIVSFEGDPARAAFLIESGQLRIYRSSLSGREQVLAILGAGDAFNVAPAFQSKALNLSTAQAIADSTILVVQYPDLLGAARDSSDLSLALLRHFADRLDHLAGLVEDLSLRSVRGRLAQFLLRNATQGSVARRWTQDEMADQLGTVRDVVGRSLRALESEGLIRIDRHQIILLDQEGLESATDT